MRSLLKKKLNTSEQPFLDIVSDVEKALIQSALEITDGNQLKAAQMLGIARTTLRKKMPPPEREEKE